MSRISVVTNPRRFAAGRVSEGWLSKTPPGGTQSATRRGSLVTRRL